MGNRRGGLFFGVIMGTILGVLFAPRKGKDLRAKLKKEVEAGGIGSETFKESFLEMGKEVANSAEKIYQKPEVQKHLIKGKKKLYGFLDEAEKKLTGMQSTVTGFKKRSIGKKKSRMVKIKKK